MTTKPDDTGGAASTEYDVIATSSPTDDRTHVLKDGETFAIVDRRGDIRPMTATAHGVYVSDTRFLSRCTMAIEGLRPLFLSSTTAAAGALLVVDLTNADISKDGKVVLSHGAVHICRTVMVRDGVVRQRLKLTSYAAETVELSLSFDVDADFVDVFEVRGHARARRGRYAPPESSGGKLTLAYRGLDDIERTMRITTSPRADVQASRLTFKVRLPPGKSRALHLTFRCDERLPAHAHTPAAPGTHTSPLAQPLPHMPHARIRNGRAARLRDACHVTSSSASLEAWLDRSRDDLRMMLTTTSCGPYPSAGVPWYSTVFGRDGIITALQTLWLDPSIAKGVLAYLGLTQATTVDKVRDAEPGKIVHEMRAGEMANLGEVPFGRYYGTVDATPLYAILAGAYLESTNDLRFIADMRPHLDAVLRWMDTYGDADGDGYLEYAASERGLTNQGWKDSNDSVFHDDGTLVTGPVALCEVQAYAFAARKAASSIYARLGDAKRAAVEEAKAEKLRVRFEKDFWLEKEGFYAIALDGKKRPCRVLTSNAGQVLWTGIASPERARRVAQALLDENSFSGWGVRTVAKGSARYNPMSYHNGTIWPHDNALIAGGLARYGMKREASRVFAAMLDVTKLVELHRLPELFCGFTRVQGKAPTLYPVACSPQAWATGAVYMFLQSTLGLVVDAAQKRVWLHYPYLPQSIRELDINGLRVGNATVDLALHRYPDGVGVDVKGRHGEVDVCMLK